MLRTLITKRVKMQTKKGGNLRKSQLAIQRYAKIWFRFDLRFCFDLLDSKNVSMGQYGGRYNSSP